MDFTAIFALIEKGLTIIGVLLEAGQSAEPAIKVLTDLITGAKQGHVSDDDLARTEALLDQLVEDFNEPLPEE